ncbi:VPDSG-CTERM sorting domain-containing protein [Puniceicoccaceae bacterium K14]|nr:VPDSG-CTERM sorting domain-containing protein [Puniceicoccaceae bacterium K14]
MKTTIKTLGILATLCLASAASAISSYTYDFTEGSWGSGVRVFGDGLQINARDVNGNVGSVTSRTDYGLGVAGDLDTLDFGERLLLKFDEVVKFESFTVRWAGRDTVNVRVNGLGTVFSETGLKTGDSYNFDPNILGSIALFEDKDYSSNNERGYYLSSVTVSKVPDGGTTAALLGLGLAGLVGLRRRIAK